MKVGSPPRAHQHVLAGALEIVRIRLDKVIEDRNVACTPLEMSVDPESTLARVARAFDLSTFEVATLLLCVSAELIPGFDRTCANISGEATETHPSFGLALAVFPDAHWDAFTPEGNLRRHRLIQLGEGEILMRRPIRVEERVLHALMGHDAIDVRLERRMIERLDMGVLPATHERIAERAATLVTTQPTILLHLWCDDIAMAEAIAVRAASYMHRRAWVIDASVLPVESLERDEFVRLWNREAGLTDVALVLSFTVHGDGSVERNAADMLARMSGPVFLVARDGPVAMRELIRLRVPELAFDEQLLLWQRATHGIGRVSDALLRDLAAQFKLGPTAIRSAANELQTHASATHDDGEIARILWRACRSHARPRMAGLAQFIEVKTRLAELVLPETQRDMLLALIGQVRRRAVVHHGWGFSQLGPRGSGTSAVFAGPSGTGKTMAAEAIAEALDLDLFRIDLSAVVSKYIGETEENLRRVFDAAEAGGAVLLFDEADALFGKRTEVRDSHDRHANIEVSYLLQRMETYCGLAVLTTNMRKALDDAFLRRVQFIVDFPFPDVDQRERIWRGVFPEQTPVLALDYRKLARLSVAGGNIRSIARNAAYIAADREQAVGMQHILEAARLEYVKLGRSLSPSEVRGWIGTSA